MFRHDPKRTGYSTSAAPDERDVLWIADVEGGVMSVGEWGPPREPSTASTRSPERRSGGSILAPSLRLPPSPRAHEGDLLYLDAETGEEILVHVRVIGFGALQPFAKLHL